MYQQPTIIDFWEQAVTCCWGEGAFISAQAPPYNQCHAPLFQLTLILPQVPQGSWMFMALDPRLDIKDKSLTAGVRDKSPYIAHMEGLGRLGLKGQGL